VHCTVGRLLLTFWLFIKRAGAQVLSVGRSNEELERGCGGKDTVLLFPYVVRRNNGALVLQGLNAFDHREQCQWIADRIGSCAAPTMDQCSGAVAGSSNGPVKSAGF